MSEPTLNTPFTHAQRKAIADLLPKLAGRLKLDEKDSRTLSFTLEELQSIQQKANEAILNADNGMIRNSLRRIIET